MNEIRVNNPHSVQQDFYKNYNPDFWLYKASLLKNCHDNYERMKDILGIGLIEIDDKEYLKMIRIEMHFLLFQMIESLFSLIFTLKKKGDSNPLLYLSFSKSKDPRLNLNIYNELKSLNDRGYLNHYFDEKIIYKLNGKEYEASFLEWVFYFIYQPEVSQTEKVENNLSIKNILLSAAGLLNDRGEYNAYKHSLRLYTSPISLSLENNKLKLGMENDDAIVFFEEEREKNKTGKFKGTGRVNKVFKSFDFATDYKYSTLIHSLLSNIIMTRKHSMISDLHGKEFKTILFNNVKFPEDYLPPFQLSRFSITI